MAVAREVLRRVGQHLERVCWQQVGVTGDLPLNCTRVRKQPIDGYECCDSWENGGHCVGRDARSAQTQIVLPDTQDNILADLEKRLRTPARSRRFQSGTGSRDSTGLRELIGSHDGMLCSMSRSAPPISLRLKTAARPLGPSALSESESERFPLPIVLLELRPEEIFAMSKQAHTEAATHHENAAKSHRSAAEHHGKDDAMSSKHSGEALSHSEKAHEASKNAHSKSSGKK
jgi:hypothetical protein